MESTQNNTEQKSKFETEIRELSRKVKELSEQLFEAEN